MGFASSAADLTGLPISKPLISGSKVGSVFPLLGVELGTNDVTIPISLGRIPSGFITISAPIGGGVVTVGSQNGADWTPSSITLQATVAGTYSVMVL
jgi:hypothetical protein